MKGIPSTPGYSAKTVPSNARDHTPSTSLKQDLPSLAFIGCGKVGRPLGRLFHAAGFPINKICCRSRESAREACSFIGAGSPLPPEAVAETAASARVILIATQDSEISRVEQAAALGVGEKSMVFHLSGALSSTVLERCRDRGAMLGSMHPLQSFADPESALEIIPGSIFTCEGDPDAVLQAESLARAIGGVPIRIETRSKSLYHAAAASASNFLLAPLLLALDLLEETGIDRKTGMQALLPLVSGTLANAVRLGVPEALTGPIERGDQIVVEQHIEAINRLCPDHLQDYLSLAGMTVAAALRKESISPEEAEGLRKLLQRD